MLSLFLSLLCLSSTIVTAAFTEDQLVSVFGASDGVSTATEALDKAYTLDMATDGEIVLVSMEATDGEIGWLGFGTSDLLRGYLV